MNAADVVRMAQAEDIRLIRFLYCDTSGILRGKASSLANLAGNMAAGIGLTRAMVAMNCLDQLQPLEGMGAVGEIRLVPDAESFVRVPYAPRTASLMCDMIDLDGRPWGPCARSALRRLLDRAAADGYTLIASFEHEFSLMKPVPDGGMAPFDRALCFSSQAMNEAADFVDSLAEALEAQSLGLEQYYPELGHGQHELSVAPLPALRAADACLRVRDTIRAVAHRHGLVASLAPKPFPDQAGNGAHVHLSMWDASGGRNLFYDQDDPHRLSPLAYQFIAGLMDHLPGLVALTCPSVNSYRRLRPSAWSSAFTVWGPDNREGAVRVASVFAGREASSANIELKCVDNTCNPHLALAGILAAGLDGVRRGLEPPPATLVDPALLSEDERRARGIRRLPDSLPAALAALEADDVLKEAMGPDLLRAFLAVKRSEAAFFQELDAESECRVHAERY